MRKRLPLLICYILIALQSFAQNLLPNGNFETYTNCPNGQNQAILCSGWFVGNSSSPDYFNTCGSGFAAVPANSFGYQNPVNGSGYMGIINGAGNATVGSGQSEYVGHGIFTLQVGITYEVSMSVSLAENSTYACDGLGAYFYKTGNNTATTSALFSAIPQASFTSYGAITDTAGWTRVTATFDADSAYNNIMIGGYHNISSTGFINAWGTNTYAYYYIDSVVVQLKNHLNVGIKDTFLCLGDSVTISAFSDTAYFSASNVFTLQLSDANGSFASPTVLGTSFGKQSATLKLPVPSSLPPGTQYRVRVVASAPALISDVNKFNITIAANTMPKPIAAGNSPVCMGDTLSLSASNIASNFTASWEGPAGFTATNKNAKLKVLSTGATGQYIITSMFHGCRMRDTVNVLASPAVFPLLPTKSFTICEGDTLSLVANSGVAPAAYSWSGPGSYSSTLQSPKVAPTTNAMSGLYIATATIGSCVTKDTVTATIRVTPAKPVLQTNGPVCLGDTIKLFGSSATPGITYRWTGPAGIFISQNVKINVAAATHAGYYVLTTTLSTCSSKDSINLSILPSAYPVLATKTVVVCEKDTIKLNSNAGPTGTTYNWSGPSSFGASTQNTFVPNSQLTHAGKYFIAQTLNTCVTRDSVTVTIKPVPAKPVANSNTPVCESDQLNLSGSTTTIGVTYSWTGPSFSSGSQNPNILHAGLNNTGNFILTATLNGCSSRDTEAVVVKPLPAKPDAAYIGQACEKDTLKLTVNNKNTGMSYHWDGPNSFVADMADTIITPLQLSAAGDYFLTGNMNGCLGLDTITVTIKNAPAKPFATSNTPVCSGKNLNLNGSVAGSGTTLAWTGPGGYSASSASPVIASVTTAQSGLYILYADLNGCKQRDTANVTVKQTPATPTVSSNSPVCIGGSLNLTCSTTPNATYAWTGPSFTSAQQNPVRTLMIPTYAGNYNATVIVDGCTSAAGTVNVQVTQGPSVSIYPNPNDTICANGSVIFAAVPNNGGSNPQFQWYKNGNTITSANKITYSASSLVDKDSFYVTMLAVGTACNTPIASNQLKMTVLPNTTGPAVSIKVEPDTNVWAGLELKFTATTTGCAGNVTYQWYGNGKPIKDANTNPWLANHLSDGTVITCVARCHDACPAPDTAESNKLTMHVSTGIDDRNSKISLGIVPNPNDGNFTLSYGGVYSLNNAKPALTIVNAFGQSVYEMQLDPHGSVAQINTGNLANGIYMLVLRFNDVKKTIRFTINK